jgi:hypothetical protein
VDQSPGQRQGRSPAKVEQIHILAGGSIESPTKPVNPGVLSIFNSVAVTAITEAVEGHRIALADWISSADNPSNFGTTGKKPTHSELLDGLASSLIADGWSIKSLRRRILLSDTHRRAAAHPDPEALGRLDPENSSYAVFTPRRLTAEELRDSMLAISGELNRTLGGMPAATSPT